jgi:hypothetical protein
VTRIRASFGSAGNGLGNQSVGELDWSGKVVGSGATCPWRRSTATPRSAPVEQRQHGGAGEQGAKVKGFKVPEVIDDAIYEVSPDGAVKWQWLASEHLNEFGFTPSN